MSGRCPLYPQKRTLVERRRSLRWPPITILLLLRRRFPILAQRQTRNLVISDHRACACAHAPRTVVRSEGSLASALSSSSAFSSNSAASGQPIAANVRIRSDKSATAVNCSSASGERGCYDFQNVSLRWNVEHDATTIAVEGLQRGLFAEPEPHGKPQKGQRGRGASMSMRQVVKSKALIDGKDEPYLSNVVRRQC